MVETFPKEMDPELVRNRLVNTGNVASASLAIGIEDSLAAADGTNQEISAKKPSLDSILSNDDRGGNTNLALRGSEINRVETKTVHSELNPCVTRTVHRKKEKKRKRSSKKGDKRQQEEEDVEMLRQIARELDREKSQLTEMLRLLSEQCQDINDESNLLEDEMEKMYGEDAIAELKARNPANAKPETNPNNDGDGISECSIEVPKQAARLLKQFSLSGVPPPPEKMYLGRKYEVLALQLELTASMDLMVSRYEETIRSLQAKCSSEESEVVKAELANKKKELEELTKALKIRNSQLEDINMTSEDLKKKIKVAEVKIRQAEITEKDLRAELENAANMVKSADEERLKATSLLTRSDAEKGRVREELNLKIEDSARLKYEIESVKIQIAEEKDAAKSLRTKYRKRILQRDELIRFHEERANDKKIYDQVEGNLELVGELISGYLKPENISGEKDILERDQAKYKAILDAKPKPDLDSPVLSPEPELAIPSTNADETNLQPDPPAAGSTPEPVLPANPDDCVPGSEDKLMGSS